MIETSNLIIQMLVFFILSFFPFIYLIKFTNGIKDHDIISFFGINFLFTLNIILFTSFINPSKIMLFISIFFISLISALYTLAKNKINNSNFLIVFFLFLLFFFISVDIANNFNFSWDVKKYYLPKATAFFQNYFVEDLTKKTEYPYYPSYLWAFFWKNSFLSYEYFGRMVYGYIYILSIFYFLTIQNLTNVLKIIFSFLILFISYQTELFDGRPDVLIFAYCLFVAKHLFQIFNNNKNNFIDFLMIILSLNLILWTKSEGLAYTLIITLSIILFLKKNIKMKFFLGFSILALVVLKLFIYNYFGLSLNPNVETFSFEILNKINFNFIFIRSYQIVAWYLMYFLTNPIMIISLISFLTILIYEKKIVKQFNYLYVIFILKFGVIFLTYMITAYPMPFHLKYSLDRIIFHTSGLFLIIVIFCLNRFLKRN